MVLSQNETAQLKSALQDAAVKCSERCLYQSAKWAAELLNSLPSTPDKSEAEGPSEPEYKQVPGGWIPSILSPNPDQEEAALEAAEVNKYLLAKTFFQCREFERCASVFIPDSAFANILAVGRDGVVGEPGLKANEGMSSADGRYLKAKSDLPDISQKSLFLALYAKFMSGEKRKDESTEMVMGPHDNGSVVNKQLLPVSRYLEAWFNKWTNEDGEVAGSQGWLEYLYGMVLARGKNEEGAMEMFIRSVHLYPMNWGCWLEMTSLINRVEDLNRISPTLPQNIVSFIFHLHTSLELYQQGPNLANSLDQLLTIFPTSSFLMACNALLSYHNKDLYQAEQNFAHLLATHPHRLDSLDHYSNILYVLNQRPKLAFLAHLCSTVDKFRPESCVVIGNYYSLLSLHERAVQYFRRALTLDRSCLSAWTLMGHEYVELKNTHAAIESYRRAVDVNRRDYRAWYGLGQTYEVLEMHAYALWYYKKAAGLRPWDGKMWMAVGSCLQKMDRYRDGIKALKRALLADSYYDSSANSFGSASLDPASRAHMDPEVLLQIAVMYESLDEEDEAKAYMELCVAQEEGSAVNESGVNAGESMAIRNDSPGNASDDDREGGGGGGSGGGGRASGEGTGVTVATSKARMWLAKFAMRSEDYALAVRLATELCQDGVEVEEAKALIREAHSRMEAEGESVG